MSQIPPHSYRGASAMIALHETEMRKFVAVWKEAKVAGVTLPPTDDPDYQSLETLLRHVFRAGRGYITWICEKLELPDPGIPATPEAAEIGTQLDSYLELLLDGWKTPLANVPEERFYDQTYLSRWKVPHNIEHMLEHAVVHPMRHSFQLERLRVES